MEVWGVVGGGVGVWEGEGEGEGVYVISPGEA